LGWSQKKQGILVFNVHLQFNAIDFLAGTTLALFDFVAATDWNFSVHPSTRPS
jgi:hypothetical protein